MGNYKGELLEHSLNVYDRFNRILQVYPEITVTEDTKILITLFHDLYKINYYKLEKDHYKTEEKFPYGDHGSKSVYLI